MDSIETRGRHFQATFESVSAYLDYIETHSRKLCSQDEGQPTFYGCSYGEAQRMARYGWPDGTAAVKRLADSLREQIERQYGEIASPAFVLDVAGSVPDVPSYLAGLPETMWTWETREINAPTVEIMCNIVVSAGVSQETIRRRGAAVCALVDLLERAGTRCAVTMVARHEGGHPLRTAEYRVTVKRPEQPLQIDALAYFLGHESASRRLGFAAFEAEPDDSFRATYSGGSYGLCNEVPEREREGAIYSGSMDLRYVDNDADAERWIVQQLAEQGITLEGGTL